jgi:Nucleotidyltransferase/Protein of unknown function (DUF1488)
MARGGIRVDFVTPNEGTDTDTPRMLPALNTNAQPWRFLDFLIRDPAPAIVLHGSGIYVHLPSPERYAVHKLILYLYRPAAIAKRDKDLRQALRILGRAREILPAIDLIFDGSTSRYDLGRDTVAFVGATFGGPVQCAISREALDDHFGTDGLDNAGRVDAFHRNRSKIERLVRRKYLSSPVEEPERVLVETMDVELL